MQNIPRIFINQDIEIGKNILIDKSIAHYLVHVMRTSTCLVFNNGTEYQAVLSNDNKYISICNKTNHNDPSNDIELFFAPIKKLDEMLNMATQLGVKKLQPVITQRSVVNHINLQRLTKIIIEASEQSGRNSIPMLLQPIKFSDVQFNDMIVADERMVNNKDKMDNNFQYRKKIFIGPEGGFSQQEFEFMEQHGCVNLSLGKTILRAEVAAVVAISKIMGI